MKRIQPKHLAHVCMLAFAGASLFNLQAYIEQYHGNVALSWSLAGALAFVLVILAALLSELTWNLRNIGFLTVLVVTTGLTIVSGAIQGSAYAKDGNAWAGYALGFALPGLGELGLALAISAYNRSLDGREVSAAQRELATGVRRHLVDAIAQVDKSLIEAQVNRAVGKVTKELVDSVVVDMITELRGGRVQLDVQPVVQLDTPTVQPSTLENTPNTSNLVVLDTNPVQPVVQKSALELANEKRKADKLDAMRIVLGAYHQNPDASLRDVAGLVNRSPETIRTWLKDMEGQGIVHVNGNVKVLRSL